MVLLPVMSIPLADAASFRSTYGSQVPSVTRRGRRRANVHMATMIRSQVSAPSVPRHIFSTISPEVGGSTSAYDQTARISVTGYTDTTGSVPYSQRLSQSRAAAVRAALVEEGVSPDEIVTAGRGKTDLAVPTADGVKEARNRRVEIVIQEPGV